MSTPISPLDSYQGYYKGINIFGHADTPTYYFFWAGVLFDGFPSVMEAQIKIDELSEVGLGNTSPVDVVPPEPVPEPIDTYRGVPIYERHWTTQSGHVGY